MITRHGAHDGRGGESLISAQNQSLIELYNRTGFVQKCIRPDVRVYNTLITHQDSLHEYMFAWTGKYL